MNFKPLGSRVLVEQTAEETTTASGIIIPDSATEKPLQGTVKAVSTEVASEGEIAIGDNIVFAKFAGTEVSVDGSKYLVMNTEDILGIIG